MRIEPGDLANAQVIELLRLHLAGMRASSPPGSVFALDLSGLRDPRVALFAAWDGHQLLGVGALKEIDATAGEIKSMRTHPGHLRKGVAAALLEHLIALGRARGYRRISLETGSGPAFEPALALYRKRGFTDGEAFGDYVASAFNRFLHLDLATAPREQPGGPAARAGRVVRRGEAEAGEPADTITLDRAGRYRRRVALTADGGLHFLLDLPTATHLADGDGLVLDDGRIVRVRAAREPLMEVRAKDALQLARIAWHVGNRHTPAEITPSAIYLQPDHVLAEMVRGLGGSVRDVQRTFEPEGGAYGGHGPLDTGHHHHGHHHGPRLSAPEHGAQGHAVASGAVWKG